MTKANLPDSLPVLIRIISRDDGKLEERRTETVDLTGREFEDFLEELEESIEQLREKDELPHVYFKVDIEELLKLQNTEQNSG